MNDGYNLQEKDIKQELLFGTLEKPEYRNSYRVKVFGGMIRAGGQGVKEVSFQKLQSLDISVSDITTERRSERLSLGDVVYQSGSITDNGVPDVRNLGDGSVPPLEKILLRNCL